MNTMRQVIPKLLPADGPGLPLPRLRKRLEGYRIDKPEAASVRKAVRDCVKDGTVKAEVRLDNDRQSYVLWRTG